MNIAQARKNFSSSDPVLVQNAVTHIGVHGSLSDLGGLIRLAGSTNDQNLKKVAIESSARLILENLLSRFSKLQPQMREKLGQMLESLDPAVMDEIVKELYSGSDERRLRALQILGLLKKHPKMKKIVAKLIADRDEKIRATAINILGKMIGPHDHEVLMALLNDSDNRVRANTIEALEQLNNKRLVPVLIRFRKDQNNRIRGNVLKALYKLGHKEIEEDLMLMLESDNDFMKASALWVVTQTAITSPQLEDMCGKCMISDVDMVERNALNALKAMQTPRAQGYLTYLAD